MAKKDLNIKGKTVAELLKEAQELKLQINKNAVDLRMKKLKNTNLVKGLKIQLAKILTLKREKELVESK